MIKGAICCEFFFRLCRKAFKKPSSEIIKPEVNISEESSSKLESKFGGIILTQIPARSSIVKGSSQSSIKNPGFGFVKEVESSESKEGMKGEQDLRVFSNVTVITENVVGGVVMDMEEAYKVIEDSKVNEGDQENDSERFRKVVKRIDFKKIFEESEEESC